MFCLVRVGVGRGDGCHETDSSFHAITKVSRIIDASAVLMMSINERANEAHHHDPILEASQEHLGDQGMKKMASPWKLYSLPKYRKTDCTIEGTRCNEGESRAHPGIQLDTFVLLLQREIFVPYVAKDAQKANSKSRTKSVTQLSTTADRPKNLGGASGDWSSKIMGVKYVTK